MSSLIIALMLLSAPSPVKKNLVLISIDTLRQDRLGCYGGGAGLTPNIDRLAQDSVLFERAYCHTPLTSPSMCTVMTSTYPHTHGSIRNGMPMLGEPITLASILRERGYHTAAFISNWTLKAKLSALDDGFELYDEEFRSRRWGKVFKGESSAEELNPRVFRWLASAQEPFFLWVHYSDPHAPYLFRPEFSARVGSLMGDNVPQKKYDTEVAYVDHHLGVFLDRLSAAGLQNPVTLFLIADHGESLGEHEYYGHGRQIYEPMMRIPFLIKDLELKGGHRVSSLMGLLDLSPTALEILGIGAPDPMKGRSLLPAIQSCRAEDERIYMETYPGAVPNVPIYKQTRRHRMPSHMGTLESQRKTIYEAREDRVSVYDVQQDPGEKINLAERASSEDLDEIKDEMVSWFESQSPKDPLESGVQATLTDEDIKALKSLGYLE